MTSSRLLEGESVFTNAMDAVDMLLIAAAPIGNAVSYALVLAGQAKSFGPGGPAEWMPVA